MVTQDIPKGYKQCQMCGEVLPRTKFRVDSIAPDGLRPFCYQCNRLANKADKSYYRKHTEKAKQGQKRYRDKTRYETAKRVRAWRTANPQKQREIRYRYESRRRASLRLVQVSDLRNMNKILFAVQSGRCLYCQLDLLDNCHLEHIVPLALSELLGNRHPGHTPPNLALVCPHCNQSKNKTILEDWLAEKRPAEMDEVLHRVDRHIALLTELWERYGEDEELWIRALGLPQPHAL